MDEMTTKDEQHTSPTNDVNSTEQQRDSAPSYETLKPVPPQLQRVKGEESGHRSRNSSVSSIGSAGDLHRARKAAQEKRAKQQRTESMTSHTSARSGMGAGGPVQYSHYNKLGDEESSSLKGIGGHGSPSLPTRGNIHKGISVYTAF